VDNIEKYKLAKKTAKRLVSVAKSRAYENLYQLVSKTYIGWLGSLRERQRDFNKVKCIKDKIEHILVKANETRYR
jgi:hypothetical protein